MKKLSLLVGALAISAVSLQASGIAARTSDDISVAPNDKVYIEVCDTFNTIRFAYVGGAFGPNANIVGQSGAYNTVEKRSTRGKFITPKNNWTNGFSMGTTLNTIKCNPLSFDYMFLRNTHNKKGSIDKGTGATDISDTKAISNSRYGDQTYYLLKSVTASYSLHSLNDFSITMQEPILETERFALAAKFGFAGIVLDHETSIDNERVTQLRYRAGVRDKMQGYGTTVAAEIYKKWNVVSFGAGVGLSAYISKTNHFVSQQDRDGGGVVLGDPVLTASDLSDLIFREDIFISLLYSKMANGVVYHGFTKFNMGSLPNSFRGFSTPFGPGLNQTIDLTYSTLTTGFGISF